MKLLIVNGWSAPSTIWNDFVRELAPRLGDDIQCRVVDLDKTLSLQAWQSYLRGLFDRDTLAIGWSLGGMLLRSAIAERASTSCGETEEGENFNGSPKGLITLMANNSFVRSDACEWGMEHSVFSAFEGLVNNQPNKGLARFRALMCKGEPEAKSWMRALEKHYSNASFNEEALHSTLVLLRELILSDAEGENLCPSLRVWSESDALASCPELVTFKEQRDQPSIKRQEPDRVQEYSRIVVLSGGGHLPMAGLSSQIMDLIVDFNQSIGTR